MLITKDYCIYYYCKVYTSNKNELKEKQVKNDNDDNVLSK